MHSKNPNAAHKVMDDLHCFVGDFFFFLMVGTKRFS